MIAIVLFCRAAKTFSQPLCHRALIPAELLNHVLGTRELLS